MAYKEEPSGVSKARVIGSRACRVQRNPEGMRASPLHDATDDEHRPSLRPL
jgi:hypothetical protein